MGNAFHIRVFVFIMFWEKFTAVCKEKGIEPEGIAKQVYASPETIAKWRAGANPSMEKLQSIASKLGVDPGDLLGDDSDELSGKGAFWNGLLKVCRSRGTDPYELAESLCISADAVDVWRDGVTPGSMVVAKLAGGLGVGVGDLFYYGDVIGAKDVHAGCMLRHELETLAESLTDENVKKVIEYAEFILMKQYAEPPSGTDD